MSAVTRESSTNQRNRTAQVARPIIPGGQSRPGASPTAGWPTRREDAAVPRSAVTCAVCQRRRTRGSHNHEGDVFICAECQADAKQFIEIQDSIWVEVGEAGESTDETDKPTHP